MRRTRKHNKNYRKTRKGGMNSRPVKVYPPPPEFPTNRVGKVKTYPPLPESPTNRVGIFTNNESLMAPKKGSKEYERRHAMLMGIFKKARERTFLNRIFGRKLPEPELDSEGNPKSFFSVNNKKVGFKP